MSVHDNSTRLCLDSLLGRVIDRDEAHEIGEFRKNLYQVARFEDVNINLFARGDALILRVHQGTEPHRFVEVTIPRDVSTCVELRTTEHTLIYDNQDVIE
jgi:hypothetical protein